MNRLGQKSRRLRQPQNRTSGRHSGWDSSRIARRLRGQPSVPGTGPPPEPRSHAPRGRERRLDHGVPQPRRSDRRVGRLHHGPADRLPAAGEPLDRPDGADRRSGAADVRRRRLGGARGDNRDRRLDRCAQANVSAAPQPTGRGGATPREVRQGAPSGRGAGSRLGPTPARGRTPILNR